MDEQLIDIAVGMSARSRTWKNQKWSWEKIAKKLTTEHRTNEDYKQFIGATKDEQLKIKDVGGFVGGYLRSGRRKPENVLHRQLITLDIDEADAKFWNIYKLFYHNAAVVHTTHKHNPTSPRFRLVMPMSREVSPDEYAAVSRHIAGTIGIDLFDNTTFQSERLMFWPSTAKDGVWFSAQQDGEWIDPDEILNAYTDWTDSSAWPTSSSTIEKVREASKKQEDPEIKRGIVGAFCRTYDIHQTIEKFLSDEYVSAGEGRYTYIKGSAAAGVVIYEDKFAFSHHGTDPISGQLCNAFDLVRVHKYGHLDNTPQSKKSFEAMRDLCTQDNGVKRTIAAERLEQSKYEFSEPLEQPDNDAQSDWMADLEVDKTGKYLSSSANITAIFKNDPSLKGIFRENIFDNKKYIIKSPPWRIIRSPEPIKNVDLSGLRFYIETIYGVTGERKIEDGLNLEFEKHKYHPIRDYLNGLSWDGENRIENLLLDYFGAEDNAYTREAIKKMLVGAVARVFNPGVKFDLVLTLVGEKQGTGKSTFINKLGGEWFSDSFHTVTGQKAFEQLQGAWLMEMAELSGTKKSEVESIKHFITKREDTFRPAYGRIVETFKRQCVFFATTNETDFLRDSTGNRRFMPVRVDPAKIKKNAFSEDCLTGDEVGQIWAEAVELYKAGEKLYLSPEAEEIAHGKQKEHMQVDERAGLVETYLETKLPDNWKNKGIFERRAFLEDDLSPPGTVPRMVVCVPEIWCECLGRNKSDMDRYKTREINELLKNIDGWELVQSTRNFQLYGKQRYFRRNLLL